MAGREQPHRRLGGQADGVRGEDAGNDLCLCDSEAPRLVQRSHHVGTQRGKDERGRDHEERCAGIRGRNVKQSQF